MLFSSLTFVFVFLPLVLLAYFACPRGNARNYVLLAASLLFYAWGEPIYLAMMLFVIFANYAGALVVGKLSRGWTRKLALAGTILANLSFLVYFKYFNFLAENLNAAAGTRIDFIKVVMPIGISFYTFQAISYLVDVYRREVSAQKNIYRLALYVALFPQLVAGPIVKYHDVAVQLEQRRERWDAFILGLKRFVVGLAKKVLIANTLGETADKVFSQPVGDLTVPVAWLGAVFYSLQLYFDFSGYSDMAIGLCRVFGFKIPENFNYPYVSKSVTEFWRRWHISLSTWFKEYLYIPLGGNRVSKSRVYANLAIVFLATGVWHGAEWTFVVWGCLHGAFIIFEKLTGWHKEKARLWQRALLHGYLLLVAVVGWTIFRSENLSYAWDYLRLMFGAYGETTPVYGSLYYLTNWTLLIFAVAVVSSTGAFRKITEAFPRSRAYPWALNAWLLTLFFLSFVFLAASTYNPFIYFRF